MARLNQRASTRASSHFEAVTPEITTLSDQENHDPDAVTGTNRGKGRAMEPSPRPSLPTPTSDRNDSARVQKRKRTTPPTVEVDEDEERFNRYFDPNQNPDIRRDVKRRSRALEREFQENRDEYLRSQTGEGLLKTIDTANSVFKEVKQTNDATLDSRLLVNISDVAYKKSAQMVLGDTSTGIDVDLFLSKCITYMRGGGQAGDNELSRSQRPRNHTRNDDDSDADDDDDDSQGEPLDWELLGQHACFPYNARPAAPTFLLGPLSLEKKQRLQSQRRPRERETAAQEARPDQLSREDLSQSNENQLTSICARIRNELGRHCKRGRQRLEQSGLTSLDSSRGKALLKETKLTDTGGPSLFEFIINPRSFGQTVENLFYVSFLIKEGAVGVETDATGMPTVVPTAARDVATQRRENTSKHQAILSLDYATWQQLTEAFEIAEPMIPHRDDTQPTQVGDRGWYS